MNERLQQKIDAIKENKDSEYFHPLMCFDAHPRKFDYDMPDNYLLRAQRLILWIEKRDEFVEQMKNFYSWKLPAAFTLLRETNEALDKFEAQLERDFFTYEKEAQLGQQLYEATYLQDQMSEEHFIMVKHLEPQIFEKFKEFVFDYMTEDEIEEQLSIIARREAEELEGILAADIQAPEFMNLHLKRLSPHDLFLKEFNNLMMMTHKTDNYCRELHAFIDEGHQTRFKLACQMRDSMPVLRRRLDKIIRQIEPETRKAEYELRDYIKKNQAAGKFTERPSRETDSKKVVEYYERLEKYQIEVFVANKHLKPEIFSADEKIFTRFMSSEEKTEFYAQIAECEEKSLHIILKAVADEIH